MGHHQTWTNSSSPRVLETIIAKIRRQPTRIEVTQPFNVVIPITGMEIVIAPNTNFVRSGVLIGFITNLGHGSYGVSMGKILNRSSKLLNTTTSIVGRP